MGRKRTAITSLCVGLFMVGAVSQVAAGWEPYQGKDAMISAMAKKGHDESMAVVGYTNGNVYLTFNANTSSPNWIRLDETYYNDLPDLRVASIAISPLDNQTFYVGFVGSHYPNKLWKTGNGGEQFTNLNFGYAEIRGISVSPADGGRTVFVVTSSGVVVSQDYGNSWSTANADGGLNVPMPQGSRVSAVAVHPIYSDMVAAGGSNGEVFYRRSSGNWHRLDEVTYPGAADLPDKIVNKIEVSRSHELALLVAQGGIGSNDRNNLWEGQMSTSGFFWDNEQSDNLPRGNMYGFYSNPHSGELYAANMFVAAFKPADVWLTSKYGLSVTYKDDNRYNLTNTSAVRPMFKIVNEGDQTIAMSDLEIRLWYTVDGEYQQQFWADHADVGAHNVNGSFISIPAKPGADYYLKVKFSGGAGNIEPGSNSGEIKTRFNKTNWSSYDLTDDFSFSNNDDYVKNTKVGLYYKGKLVWGVEP